MSICACQCVCPSTISTHQKHCFNGTLQGCQVLKVVHADAERVLDVAEVIRKHKSYQRAVLPWLLAAQPSEAWVSINHMVCHCEHASRKAGSHGTDI